MVVIMSDCLYTAVNILFFTILSPLFTHSAAYSLILKSHNEVKHLQHVCSYCESHRLPEVNKPPRPLRTRSIESNLYALFLSVRSKAFTCERAQNDCMCTISLMETRDYETANRRTKKSWDELQPPLSDRVYQTPRDFINKWTTLMSFFWAGA